MKMKDKNEVKITFTVDIKDAQQAINLLVQRVEKLAKTLDRVQEKLEMMTPKNARV